MDKSNTIAEGIVEMLHTKGEGVARTFNAVIRRLLNKYASELDQAKTYAEIASRIKSDTRGAIADIFNATSAPCSVAFHVDDGSLKGQILCLDMGVKYKANMAMIAKVLGHRREHVLVTEPVFSTDKAKAALKAGIVTEAELAKCVTATPTLAAQVRHPADGRAPKGIEPGEAKVTPLKLAKGVKLDWG